MPDFAGCIQQSCQRKYKCARYMMKFDKFNQSYIRPPYPDDCTMYWTIGDMKQLPFHLDLGKLNDMRETLKNEKEE